MVKPDDQPRRRFAPVPIETTFQSVRKTTEQGHHHIGPNPELTPEASPRSPSPRIPQLHELHGRRRFAPQLVETSRRTRRVGDEGPATRPADKTDITPYTNHIYSAKAKQRRRRDGSVDDEPERPMPPTRRETEEEGVKEYLLELAAKDAARQIEEAALAAFPNSRAREGGVAHFYYRESSDSDNSPEGTSPAPDQGHASKVRRKSSNMDLTWWQKHMQRHAEKLSHGRDDDDVEGDGDVLMRTDSELDKMELPAPPDPLWTTNNRIPPEDRRDSMAEIMGPRREPFASLRQPDPYSSNPAKNWHNDASAVHTTPALNLGGPVKPHTPVSHMPPSDAGRDRQDNTFDRPFGRAFGAFGMPPEDPKLLRMRQAASPPMLGKDLAFRKCPSPKQTKLETDHSFARRGAEERNRDISGEGGLWNGYCCRSEEAGGYIVPADLHAPNMMVTPLPGTPREPCAPGFESQLQSQTLCEEPFSVHSSSSDSSSASPSTGEHRLKSGTAKGLHMLHGLDERLRQEKAMADREEKISQEFDDEFVTQVYNYLSLGYPAMARAYDDELAKISLVSVDELGQGDEAQMAKGHLVEMKMDEMPDEARCPRWRALRTYIMEWARQHQDLDNLDPLAWGVRARRGSWAI